MEFANAAKRMCKSLAIAFLVVAGLLAMISSIATNGSLTNDLCAIASFGYLMLAFVIGILNWLR